jgi:hypothetical protein
VDHVVLDAEVFVDEVSAIGIVGVDAANPGRGEEDVVGLFCSEEIECGTLVEQVEFLPGAGDQVGEPPCCRRRTMAEPTMPRWPAI